MKKATPFLFLILIFSVFFSYKTAHAYDFSNFQTNLADGYDNGSYIGFSNCSANVPVTYISYWFQLDGGTPEKWVNAGQVCYSSTFQLSHTDFISVADATLTGTQDWDEGHTLRLFFSNDDPPDPGTYWLQTDISGGFVSNDITATAPEDESTGVNAITHFSGLYTNDGTDNFNAIEISISATTGDTSTKLYRCGDPSIGTSLTYGCNITLALNTTYDYNAQLCDLTQTYPFGCITDTTKTFTTGDQFSDTPIFGGNDCATFDVGCYIIAGGAWLFMPGQDIFSSFGDLYATFEDKPPFGYLSAIKSALEGLNTTETAAFTLQSMDVIDTYIFDPMRTALVAILWLAFAFMFFHRLKNLQL